MTYHDLSECTLSPSERANEAKRIIAILDKEGFEFTPSENKFMTGLVESDFNYVSVKQLFWLRDIKDKYL